MIKSKKLSVTIGIPAYNEEANIISLLSDILSQKETNFSLTKIIVVSDASTDNTDRKVLAFRDKRLKLIRNDIRRGQIYNQNKIFNLANTDIVVLLEADTLMTDKIYLNRLIAPFIKNNSIVLSQGNWIPILGNNLIGKALSTQANIYNQLTRSRTDVIEMLCSGRGGRAFAKKIYKKLQLPLDVPEDVYVILWCKKHFMKTKFQKSATLTYRCPETFSDYQKEIQKIKVAERSLNRYFSKKQIEKMYRRPFSLSLKIAALLLLSHPILFFTYLFIRTQALAKPTEKQFNDLWPITQTTKLL